MQRKPFPFHVGTPRPDRLPATSGHATSVSSSDGGSSNSSKEGSDHGSHLRSNKRLRSNPYPIRSSTHKRKGNRGSVDEDDEYEVEQILEVRVNLQYRAKWLGYESDPEWYDACNFKNSPHKLRDFHKANPTHLGPPKRLEEWVQCCEKGRTADDHPDDNKPERSHRGGGTQ